MPLRSTGIIGVDNQTVRNTNLVESCQTSQVYYLGGTRKVVQFNENELQVKRLDCMRVTDRTSISPNAKLIPNSLMHANDNFQMNAASRQSQKGQQQQSQYQQLQVDRNVSVSNQQNTIMVSEDIVEQSNFSKNSAAQGVNNSSQVGLTSNDLLNHTQIIKLVTDGENGNLLIDPSTCGSNTMNTGLISSHHGNSKVHVISNVTFVSKQIGNSTIGQTQQTINVVNAKGMPYLASKHQMQSAPVMPKIGNMPTKNTSGKSGNSGNISSPHNQNLYLSGTSGHASTSVSASQKSSVPRNVQVVARTQNISPSTSQLLIQNMQSPSTNNHHSSQQDMNSANNQMVLQQKIMTNANTSTNSKSTPKKHTLNQSLKFVQHKCTNSTIGARSSQNYFSQQAPQMQSMSPGNQNSVGKLAKSQKLTRQSQQNVNTSVPQCIQQINCGNIVQSGKVNNYCQQQNLSSKLQNSSNPNSCNKYVMQTQILSTIANQTPVNNCKVVTTHNSCNVINSNASVCNLNVLNSNSTSNSNSNNNYNINNANNSTLHGGTNTNKIGTMGNVNASGGGNLVVIQNNAACGNMSTNNKNTLSGSTIKYVSAHGTVVQSQHMESSNQFSLQQQSQSLASKGRGRLPSQTSKHRNDQNFLDGRSSILPSDIVNSSSTYIPVSLSSKQSGKNEEIMIVNGTQMTEEMSARILQSLSQKALHNSNAKQYQSSHATLSHLHDPLYGQKNSTIIGSRSNGIDTSPVKEEYAIPIVSLDCEKQETHYMDFSVQPNQFHNHNMSHPKLQISQQSICSQRPLCSKTVERTHSYERFRPTKTVTEVFKVIGDNAPAAQHAEHEDDIGEEIRPQPVSTTDMRIHTLHAVLQDHNYVAQMPSRIQSEIQSTSNLSICASTISSELYVASCNATQDSGGNSSNLMQQQIISPSSGNLIVPPNSISPSIGLPFLALNDENRHDDDANSVISDESRTGPAGLDNDLGEETETAPEAEAEDDSVTRCICDLTHDDGYMICCDKCSAWQHVDCMGIDRQNIPDEYLCEICQPREVDRARAKNLQLTKRREQISFPITSAQTTVATLSVSGSFNNNENHSFQNSNLPPDRLQSNPVVTASLGTPPVFSKKNKSSGSAKRKELLKRSKKERNSSKRRDVKRVTRRKKTSYSISDIHSNERSNTSINQWLENYEVAVTNHYSPELRARLHAICKQQNVMQSVIATENKILKNCSGMQSKCTTVPFSGGKILISNFDIQPNTPIVELRGKYMLTTQYKTQNPSVNTNNNVGTPPNPHAIRNQKIPGPFIFFYKLCNEMSAPEICVDTRTYANEARFVRRSCRPNAEIQHYFEKGTLHLYLVSTAFINGGTEITIKHEPHDLSAVNNKQISVLVAPTSTICACDAPKECLFSNHIGNIKVSRKMLVNGYVGEKFKNISAKKEIPSSIARGRSVSSSGESNIGLLSPTNQNAGFHNPPSIGNLQNDSGVYTSSSSPSVSLPSPTHAQIISSPTQQCQKSHSNPKTHAESLEIPVHSASSANDNGFSKGLQRLPTLSRKSTNKQGRHSISEDPTTSAAQINFQDDKHENRKLSREERKMDAIIRAFEKMEKTQQRKQELKQARSTVAVGKTRASTSPSPKGVKSQIASETDTCTLLDVTQVRKGALSSAKKRKRKGSKSHLTNQQKRRRRINSNDSDILSSGESCLLSPTLTSNGDSKPVMNSNLEDCENQINIQELVDNSNLVVNDQNINHAAGLLLALANNDAANTEQVAVAAVNNSGINKREEKDTANVDLGIISQDLGNQTPPIVSSTCLLVEAAVAPLENADAFVGEFKLPAKTKTKKSIMNDWLNQSLDFQHPVDDKANLENQTKTQLIQNFDPKGLDTLVQAAATICDYRRSTSSPASYMNSSNDEAQNISIAAKKVEEFIHQTNINLQSNEELSKQVDTQTNNIDHQNHKDLPVCLPHSINNCLGGSSVKKRWLRQAISEECSDELTTCLPATSPTQLGQNAPVGFTTPLKKRRVIRQCTEEEHNIRMKDRESPTLVRMNPSPDEIKTEIKDEFGEIDEEVDIINCPIQEEKVYKESFVKIENEANVYCKSEILSSPSTTLSAADIVAIKEEVKDLKVHFSEIKAEKVAGEKSCDSKNEVIDAIDIQLQTAALGQVEDYVDVSDEIADIQKRLHSFHTENIMILQSRNKKSKISRSVKADSMIPATNFLKNGRSDKHDKGISKHEEMRSFKKEKHSSSKRKHLDFDDFSNNDVTKLKEDDISKKEQMKSKQFVDQPSLELKSEHFYSKEHSGNEVSDLVELQVKPESKIDYNVRSTDGKMFQAALTIPNFNQTIIPPSTTPLCRSNYSLENPENEISSSVLPSSPTLKLPLDAPQSDEKLMGLTNESQPTDDTEIPQPPPMHLPYFNTIYGKLIDKDSSSKKGVSPTTPSTNILLSDYLDTKVRSYSTLGGYVSHSALFGLNNSTANSTMELMNIGSVNCSQTIINKDDELVNSNDNNNNTSRIGGAKNVMQTATNTKSTLFKTNEAVSQCLTSTCSKIMTKTANADPRLNPTLTAPEPAPTPKRKLSINEYRKRKQLSSEATGSGNGTMTSKNLLFKTSSERTSRSREQDEDREKSFGDISSTYNAETINEAKVQFSPTPTLLEQQQETLCERLKSLKSQSSSLHSTSSPCLGPESNIAIVPKLICNATSASFNSIKAIDEKEEFLLSHNVNISSLESISSSSSPVSSKESTPERDICRS